MSDEILDLEHRAYEAALVPEHWPAVLERLARFSDTAGAAYVSLNERGASIVCSPSLDESKAMILEGDYMSRSGRAEAVIRRGLVGMPRFVNEDDYYDDPSEAETDPIVRDVFRPRGMGWAAGFLMQMPEDDMLIVNIEQHYDKGPIRGASLAALDAVYPILARATMIAARAEMTKVKTAIDTLSDLGMPAAAVSPSGRVTMANALFDDAATVWTTRGGERLALHDALAQASLERALGNLDAASGQRSIPIRDPLNGLIAGVVQVVPIRRSAHDLFGNSAAIIVLNRTRTAPDARLVHSLFDLTPAELSVAHKIAAGLSVAQIAAAGGRSPATVRNQLKSVMEKTGTTRQVELTLLMTQLAMSPDAESR